MSKTSKSGARHSAGDQMKLQEIHDTSAALGAACLGTGKFAKAGSIRRASKGIGDIPGLRGCAARACWSCQSYKPVEGEWDEGQCTKFDAPVEDHWMCDAWAVMPSQPLQVVIVEDAGSNETMSADSPSAGSGQAPAMLSVPNYVKSLHLGHDEQFMRDVLAVKFVGKDDIKGYMTLWGDPKLVDLETEFFTNAKSVLGPTDFWDKTLGSPRPLTWNHAQDKALVNGSQIVGKMVEFGDDEVGRFYNAVLDRSHKYRAAVAAHIAQRNLGTSSDSAPQYVERVKMANGSVWLKQWPLFAAALTDVPCEPRMIEQGNVYWKSVGVDWSNLQGQNAEASAAAARVEFEQKMASAKRDLELLKLQS